ncbi:hypothetical protein GCM10023187_39880 [Nibrella viscosa]|uniref:Uncharacterized protein n=1 Tax=Nibrella viscosa TaxID=1084524 RepID=A0ABP8KQE8_9BACT
MATSISFDFSGFRGVPNDLTEKAICYGNTIPGQTKYEEYLQRKITKEEWQQFKVSAGHRIDTTLLSPQPIKHRINTLIGKDKQGRRVVIVDANNNQDFSDDQVLYYFMTLPCVERNEKGHYTRAAIKEVLPTMPTVKVNLEAFDGKKVVQRTVWIRPNPYNDGTTYADTTLNRYHLDMIDLAYHRGVATILGRQFTFEVRPTPTLIYTKWRSDFIIYPSDEPLRKMGGWFTVDGHRIEIAGISVQGDKLTLIDRGSTYDEITLKKSFDPLSILPQIGNSK